MSAATSLTLLLTELPVGTAEAGASEDGYCGRLTASAEFVQAALETRQLERVALLAPRGTEASLRKRLSSYREGRRVELVGARDVGRTLSPRTSVVLQSFTPSLRKGMHLRWVTGAPSWPVVGMTHDLSSQWVYDETLLTVLGRPRPYDAVVCSTVAAREAYTGLLERAVQVTGVRHTPRTPVVPLGTHAPSDVLPRRADARRALGWSEDELIYLYFGRLDHRRKADLVPLVRVFSHVRNRWPRARLVLAGAASGDEEHKSIERYREASCALGVGDAVGILSNVDEPERRRLLAASDVFVSPADSLQESFGLVLLEAMSAGLAIVASDFDGYRDVLVGSSAALLVPTYAPSSSHHVSELAPLEDSVWTYGSLSQSVVVDVRELEYAMLSLAACPERRQRMGDAGRRHVERHFTWPVIMQRQLDLWQTLGAAALECGEPCGPSPFYYDHGQVFRRHVSALIDLDAAYRLAPDATSALECVVHEGIVEEATLHRAVRRLEAGPLRFADLALDPRDQVTLAAYLLKHGVIQPVGAQPSPSEERPEISRCEATP